MPERTEAGFDKYNEHGDREKYVKLKEDGSIDYIWTVRGREILSLAVYEDLGWGSLSEGKTFILPDIEPREIEFTNEEIDKLLKKWCEVYDTHGQKKSNRELSKYDRFAIEQILLDSFDGSVTLADGCLRDLSVKKTGFRDINLIVKTEYPIKICRNAFDEDMKVTFHLPKNLEFIGFSNKSLTLHIARTLGNPFVFVSDFEKPEEIEFRGAIVQKAIYDLALKERPTNLHGIGAVRLSGRIDAHKAKEVDMPELQSFYDSITTVHDLEN